MLTFLFFFFFNDTAPSQIYTLSLHDAVPIYGRVSRFGVVAFASSLDQVGTLTKTVRDSAMIMNAIAGHDPQETTSLNEPVPDYTEELGKDLRGARLGLAKEYMIEGIDPQVKTAIDAAVKHVESLGA